MRTILICASVVLFGCGSGSGSAPESTVVKAAIFGDSLTNQSNTTIMQFLPTGSELIIFGVDGHTAFDAFIGYGGAETYESKLARVPSDYCVILGYGTNEAIQNIPPVRYSEDIARLIGMAKIAHRCVILDAPVFIRPISEEYIAVLYNFGIPVSSKPYVGLRDGIHPDSLGYVDRARELASVLIKNK